jgi:hypothetical protein
MPQNVGRCTDVEITPPSPRPPPARVKPWLDVTTTLFSTSSTAFISSTTLLFALSRFGLHPTFNLCHVAFFYSFHVLCFLGFFNGGNFRTATRFRAAITFPFCIHLIFLVLSEPLHRLALHDIFDCTTYAHRSARHVIFIFITYAIF